MNFIKGGFAYVKVRHKMGFEEWFKRFLRAEARVMGKMGVRGVVLI